MLKVVTVVGARPQFIKAAAVSRRLRERAREVLVHTGQHCDREMSELFFEQLDLPRPDHNLGVGSGSHGVQTGAMLGAVERALVAETPDLVLVYGDTNSTLAGALAAVKLHIPVAHVEAGLRSFDRRMPEEVNRVLTDHMAAALFCPTQVAVDNLGREGISAGVELTGDVGYDAFLLTQRAVKADPRLGGPHAGSGGFVLCTLHRPENVDEPGRLLAILEGLEGCGLQVLLPLHPRTRAALNAVAWRPGPATRVLDPVGYPEMVALEGAAAVIVTDSGGVQKEAYFAGVPCVTVRDSTEWVETVVAGWNVLVGPDSAAIRAAAAGFRPAAERPHLFGDGHAASRVVGAIERMFGA